MIDLCLFLLSSLGIYVVYFFLFPRTLKDWFFYKIHFLQRDLDLLIYEGKLSADVGAVASLRSDLQYLRDNEIIVRFIYYVQMQKVLKKSPLFQEYMKSLPKSPEPPAEMAPYIQEIRSKITNITALYCVLSSPILGLFYSLFVFVASKISGYVSSPEMKSAKMNDYISQIRVVRNWPKENLRLA